jgi:hypothetical protein
MPTHIYSICSVSGLQDRDSGLLSLIHVIEELTATAPAPGQPIVPFVFRVTSVWMREDGDDAEQEYEHQVTLRIPQADANISLLNNRFRFNSRLAKFIAQLMLQNVFAQEIRQRLEGESLVFIDTSIRPVGTEPWQTHSYPILLRLSVSHAPDHANGEPAAEG